MISDKISLEKGQNIFKDYLVLVNLGHYMFYNV